MADLTLTLGVPSGDRTLPAEAGLVRRVVLPKGTREIVITSESAFYVEIDPTQAKVDEAASDNTKRMKHVAGTYVIPCPGAGRGAQELTASRFLYLVGTENEQPFWILARGERASG